MSSPTTQEKLDLITRAFIRLRQKGFKLGVGELFAAQQALAGGFGETREALAETLKILWCSSPSQQSQFEPIWQSLQISSTSKSLEKTPKKEPKTATPHQQVEKPQKTVSPPSQETLAEIKTEPEVASLPVQAAPFTPVENEDRGALHEYYPISRRSMVYNWRYLRRLVPDGTLDILDIDATIERATCQGFYLSPVYRHRKRNHARLLLLVDQNGSMTPFHRFSRDLVETALYESSLQLEKANEEHRTWASQAVERFVSRFDESYRILAYHAALPLVLTPELVNYLRNEFLRKEKVPWVAEVDLLLSELCSQVGYELYAMDTHVRAYLLEQMEKDKRFGKQRMREVAQVLISYVNYLKRLNPERRKQEIEAQKLAAMVYLEDEECKAAAREIAERLLEISSGTGSKKLNQSEIRAQLARLTRITEELSRPLRKQESLLKYARLVQQILRNPDRVNSDELRDSYHVEGVELRLTDKFLPEPLAKILAVSKKKVVQLQGFPPLQDTEYESFTIVLLDGIELFTQQFEVAEIVIESEDWETFEFITAKLERKQKSARNESTIEWVIREQTGEAQRLIESLNEAVTLEMVLIPPGEFIMGAAPGEQGSSSSEQPQHKVTLQEAFLMGRYPVTQEQWQAVAALPQINRKLEAEPSGFKGNKRPVETVSWEEAKEFCDRLSRETGREYRLPTEAEWEYACRSVESDQLSVESERLTVKEWNEKYNQPFHFGETISTELANYDGEATYGEGVKGEYRRETTPVGEFPANEFGLCDMHGNVWEWCEDDWHENYEGAPTDGSAWRSEFNNIKVLRGGSWDTDPAFCRSAFRSIPTRGGRNDYISFRIACVIFKAT